jgi:hypothetical protein
MSKVAQVLFALTKGSPLFSESRSQSVDTEGSGRQSEPYIEDVQMVSNVLMEIIDRDVNLRNFKEKFLASELSLEDIRDSTAESLTEFMEQYLLFAKLAALKCARVLKKLVWDLDNKR